MCSKAKQLMILMCDNNDDHEYKNWFEDVQSQSSHEWIISFSFCLAWTTLGGSLGLVPLFIIIQNRVIIICNCYVSYQSTETKEKHAYLRSKWWAASWMRMMLILSLDDCNTCRTAARQHAFIDTWQRTLEVSIANYHMLLTQHKHMTYSSNRPRIKIAIWEDNVRCSLYIW